MQTFTDFMTAKERLEKERTARMKMVDDCLKYPPGPQRWRAAVNMWLKINPKNENGLCARDENYIITHDNAEHRSNLVNKYGTSGDNNSSFRSALRMPGGALHFIELVDPGVFDDQSNMSKIVKEFPEYTRLERW